MKSISFAHDEYRRFPLECVLDTIPEFCSTAIAVFE